jgi:uncharacterized protein YhaN
MRWGEFMEIKELKIKNFGKFHNKTIEFTPGINLIYGENESGKTTIYHFIKSMFFGIENKRGKAAQFDSYHLYEPWENPLFYEGELRFKAGGRNFRLERGFHKNYKKENLINEEDAEELSIEQGDLLHILDGLNESIFKNTLAIGQLKSEMDEGLASELKNYTAGFTLSGDGGVNVSKALTKLSKLKKEKEVMLREKENKRLLNVAGLKKEQEYIQLDLLKKENQRKEYLSLHKERKQVLLEQKNLNVLQYNRKRLIGNIMIILLVLVGIIFIKPFVFKAASVLLGGIVAIVNEKWQKKALESRNTRLQESDSESNRLEGILLGLKEDIQDKEVQMSNLAEVLLESNRSSEQEASILVEIKALDMAYKEIFDASLQLQKEMSEGLNKRASQILSFLTKDKYMDIRIDNNIATRLNTKDKVIYEEQVSKGTVDEIHFAVRMAFLELFFQDEKMPLILDDAFVMYDNKRLARALQYLTQSKRQVILFTCHTREEQIMNQLGLSHNKILLASLN